MLEKLNICEEDSFTFTYWDHLDMVRMFGAELAGPEHVVYLLKQGAKQEYLVYYNDDGIEIRRERVLP